MKDQSFFTKLISAIGSAMLIAIIGFFVWLANLASEVRALQETKIVEREASRRIEDANREAIARIEHEREANDSRVRDDLRELRTKVFQ